MDDMSALQTSIPQPRQISFRESVSIRDVNLVHEIVRSSGFFYDAEVSVAIELVEDRLRNGTKSDYCFLFAEAGDQVFGYSCYGTIPCTKGSYDIHWIAVYQNLRRCGIGRQLLSETEARIKASGGRKIYVDTSGREQYFTTRRFYEACGYEVQAILGDFYAVGDDKIIYGKVVV